MRFLVDAQLPPALARWLADHGQDAEHVVDRHLEAAPDAAIWELALRTDAVIVTKDEDFAQRKALLRGGPRIVWVRLPNLRRKELLTWFDQALPDILAALDRGETMIEVI